MMSKMCLLLFLTSFLACWQFGVLSYPMQGSEQMLDSYRMGLAKKDPSLKDSLLSALLMSDIPRGTPSQRKKAVDSTFIRFGRSSMPDSNDAVPDVSPSSTDFDYFSGNNAEHTKDNGNPSSEFKNGRPKQELIQTPIYFDPNIRSDCLLKTRGDLFRALMGKSCVKPKVKRENVNDTFIRFGKRAAPNPPPESSNQDSANQIRYGR